MPLPLSGPDEYTPTTNPEDIPSPFTGTEGRFEQVKIGAEHAFEQSSLGFDLALQATQHYNPGPLADPSIVPDDLKKKYPNGIGQNTLSLIEKEKDLKDEQETALSLMQPGKLTSALNFGSNIIGTALQPKNAAAMWFSEAALPAKLFGLGKAAELSNMAKRSLSATRGAVLGEAVNSEINLFHYHYNKELGSEAPLSLFDGSMEAGLGGGLLGGLFTGETNAPASGEDGPKAVLNTAVTQLIGDKNVEISPLIKQSIHESGEAMRKEGIDENEVEAQRNDYQNQIDDLDEEIKKIPEDKDISPLLGGFKLNKVMENIYEPGKQSSADIRYNRDTQSMEPYGKLAQISPILPHLRDDVSQQALENFMSNPEIEKNIVNKNLTEKAETMDKLRSKVEDLDEKIKQTDKPELKQERLDTIENIRGLHKLLKQLNDRMEEIKNVSRLPKKVLKPLLQREILKAQRMDLRNLRDHHDALLQYLRTDRPTGEEMMVKNQHINSEAGDMYLDKPGDNLIDRDIKDSEPLTESHYKEHAQRLLKEGKITPEEMNEIKEDVGQKKGAVDAVMKVFDKFVGCIKGES